MWPPSSKLLTLALATLSLASTPYPLHEDDFSYTEGKLQNNQQQQQQQQQPQQGSWRDTRHHSSSQYRDVPPILQDQRGFSRDYFQTEGRQRRQTEQPYDENSFSGKLRRDLLSDYDAVAFPWESVWEESGWVQPGQSTNTSDASNIERTGLPVEVGINYYRILSVDVTMSIADIYVWFHEKWYDPRLTWNPDDYGGVEQTWFWIGDDKSEIWTPDIELWNQESSLSESLSNEYAVVKFDGHILWSRAGHLRPVCNFEGLTKFPFDTLSCVIEIGSWVYSGKYLRPTLMDETGFTFGARGITGEAYAEFKLTDISTEVHVYPPFPLSPEEDWPAILYTITFSRAWQPYIRGYLLLQIILNLTAMACFWLPPHCGERMLLGMTSLLASVTSDLVVSEKLPSVNEVTSFDNFSIMSRIFIALVLFETAMVIYFYYLTADSLTPRWIAWMIKKKETHNPNPRSNAKQKSFLHLKEMQNNIFWQKLSRNIDEFSRVAFPVGYAIGIGVITSNIQ